MKFAYKAVDLKGNTDKGTVEATTRQAAILELKERGLFTTEIHEQKGVRGRLQFDKDSILSMEIHFGPKVKSGEFAIFTRQLATLIRAGVMIGDAVKVLAQQTENKTFAKALTEVAKELLKGSSFSQSLSERKDIFPTVFINMTRAAEASGNLDEILDRMAVFFEKEHYTKEKVKSALTYPIIVSVMAVGVTAFLLTNIVPTFVNLFASFHAQLPLPTRIVMGASHFMTSFWYIILIVFVGGIVGYKVAMTKERGRFYRDTVIMRLPVFGTLFVKSVMARMGRTLSTLFTSAVPVLQALQLTSDVVDNAVVSRALVHSAKSLTSGQSLSEPLSQHWVFPPLVIHMVKVGEETGNLDSMLTKIADFYEAETEAMVDRLKSLLEPIMMLVLSAIVGTIITAVIMPMFSLYGQVGNMG